MLSKKQQAAYLEALAVEAAREALAARMIALQPAIAAELGEYLHFVRGVLYVAGACQRCRQRDFVMLLKQIRQDGVLPGYADDEVLAWLKACSYWLPCNPFPLIPAWRLAAAKAVAFRIAAGSGRRPLSPAVTGEIERLFAAMTDEALGQAFAAISMQLRLEKEARRREGWEYDVDPDTGEIVVYGSRPPVGDC